MKNFTNETRSRYINNNTKKVGPCAAPQMAAALRPFFEELSDHAVQAGAQLRCAMGLLKQGMIIAVHAADAHLLS